MGKRSELTSVHGQTTDSRTDIEPSAATGLAESSEVVVRVASNTNGGASIRADSSDFTALQAHRDLPDLLANLLF